MEKIKHLQPLKDDNHWTCPECGEANPTKLCHFELGKKQHSYVKMVCNEEPGGCGFEWNVLMKSEGWLPEDGDILDLIG